MNGAKSLDPGAIAFGFLTGMFMAGSTGLAITIEVFSRWRFGERYLTIGRIIGGYFALLFVNWIASLAGIASFLTGGFVSTLLGNTGYAPKFSFFDLIPPIYLALCIFHYVHLQVRRWRGIVVYSYSTGEVWWAAWLLKIPGVQHNPITRRLLNEWTIYQYVEPLGCIVMGWIMGNVIRDQFLGSWLSGAGVGLFFRNGRVISAYRDQLLDEIDAKIMTEELAPARTGRPKRETKGFSVPSLPKRQYAYLHGGEDVQDVKLREQFDNGVVWINRWLDRMGQPNVAPPSIHTTPQQYAPVQDFAATVEQVMQTPTTPPPALSGTASNPTLTPPPVTTANGQHQP